MPESQNRDTQSGADTKSSPDLKSVPKNSKIKNLKNEFVGFLWEYSVLGLAIGVIIGGAVNSLVQSLVAGIITPLLQLIIPSEAIKNLSYTYNGVTFAFGPLINAFINFLIVAFLVFAAVKIIIFRGKKIEKSKISKV